ncbi:hypothetical protein RchiOBHm_Chr5g0033021 [Rosa chinensis]|uniref:Uncharacterized protein n=1 Tax=Rosa chinensis TaxID=74649 RepID=A0A2P6QAM7_ROSCH|nr:hypothetical protein RchiOBHm_Chr5g0033021 [Rosa chinensis]
MCRSFPVTLLPFLFLFVGWSIICNSFQLHFWTFGVPFSLDGVGRDIHLIEFYLFFSRILVIDMLLYPCLQFLVIGNM